MPAERDPETGRFTPGLPDSGDENPRESLEQTLRALDAEGGLDSLGDDEPEDVAVAESDAEAVASSAVEAGQASPENVDDSTAELVDEQAETAAESSATVAAPTESPWWKDMGHASAYEAHQAIARQEQELNYFRNWQRQQQEEQQRLASEANKPTLPTIPQEPKGWERYVVTDEATGRKDWSDKTPPELIQQFDQWNEFQTKLRSDPYAAIKPYMQQDMGSLRDEVKREVLQEIEQRQTRERLVGAVAQHAAWIYEKDGAGNAQFNPATLEGSLSPWGRVFQNHLNRAQSIPDPQARIDAALEATAKDMEIANLRAKVAGSDPSKQDEPDLGKQAKQNLAAKRPQTRELATVGSPGVGTEQANGESVNAHDFIASAIEKLGINRNSTMFDLGRDD